MTALEEGLGALPTQSVLEGGSGFRLDSILVEHRVIRVVLKRAWSTLFLGGSCQ
jgi:hypothetical protein